MPELPKGKKQSNQPSLSHKDPEESIKRYLNRVNIPGFSIEFRLYNEMDHIRQGLGLSQNEFLRFCITNTVLSVKHAKIAVYLSEEYMDERLKETATDIFNKLKGKLNEDGVNVKEI